MSEDTGNMNPAGTGGNPPAVSVIMPVFNGERHLVEAVESILNQTFADFEFIIIDDGSSDGSLAILQRFAAKDARIRLRTRGNKGLGPTQRELAELARGEFVAQLDHDDVALPDRLALQVEFLRSNPKAVCVGGDYQLIDGAGRFLTTLRMPKTDAEIQALNLRGHCALLHPGAMMRRRTLVDVGSYDTRYCLAADLDLWLRLGEAGQLANLDAVILKYRLHDKSASEKSMRAQRDEAKQACENAWRRRGINGVFDAVDAWRPGPDRASQHAYALKYGWWAWNSRQRSTAIHYAVKAIRNLPLSIDGWKLLLVALLKPLAPAVREQAH